ncbi:sulfotransferase [Nocardioides sp.]|uniref:sulfotransferase n=1 Tax=Nocardioides sp. TaxID=35761 RepID=UPI0035628FF8
MRGATTVVFIAGGGRSGTTLLGNAVGSFPGALSVGEVKLAFRRGVVEQGHCGCRAPVLDCPVWAPALAETFGGPPSPALAAELDRRLTGAVRTRTVPWWWAGRQSAEIDELADTMARMIRAVARASGADTIVDSSKFPAYGALLARSPLLDVRVVHVVRDPRAVAWSWQRASASQQVEGFEEEMERFSVAKTSLMWLTSNAAVPAVAPSDAPRPLVVGYERLVRDPAGELARIAEHAGLASPPDFVRHDRIHLGPNHAVAGNPNRVRVGPVELRPDDEWRSRMSRLDKAVVTVMTAPGRSRRDR